MSYDSDVERLRKNAEGQGWRYRRTENNHHQFLSPDGETIVHAPGTPSDQRSWNNFIADMRRGGYREHPNGATLGEMAPGLAKEQAAPSKASARMLLRDHFAAHPLTTFKAEELSKLVAVARPDLAVNSTFMTLSKMAERGELTRVKPGWYRLATEADRVAKAIGAQPPPSSIAGDLSSASQPARQAAPPEDEPPVEDDELDQAVTKMLDAFAAVERIIRKHRGMMRKVDEFKRIFMEDGK